MTSFKDRFTLGALVSFLVTVADLGLLNIGAAFWGLVAGFAVSWLHGTARLQRIGGGLNLERKPDQPYRRTRRPRSQRATSQTSPAAANAMTVTLTTKRPPGRSIVRDQMLGPASPVARQGERDDAVARRSAELGVSAGGDDDVLTPSTHSSSASHARSQASAPAKARRRSRHRRRADICRIVAPMKTSPPAVTSDPPNPGMPVRAPGRAARRLRSCRASIPKRPCRPCQIDRREHAPRRRRTWQAERRKHDSRIMPNGAPLLRRDFLARIAAFDRRRISPRGTA